MTLLDPKLTIYIPLGANHYKWYQIQSLTIYLHSWKNALFLYGNHNIYLGCGIEFGECQYSF